LEAILPTQEELASFVGYCNGLNVDFENDSYGGTNYAWDFGVPGITTDVSTAAAPSYTYPFPGTFTARLVVNPGWPCTDTAYMTVKVDNTFYVDFTASDSVCFTGNSVDFQGTSNVPLVPGTVTTYNWDFGPNASIATALTQNVNNVSFNQAGFFPVTLYGQRNECEADTTINVAIFALPVTDFAMPADYECEGQTIQFTNTSLNSIVYEWNFGDPSTLADTSNQPSPSYTYPGPGIYTIQLISGSTGACFDTVEYTYEIYADMLLDFTHQDSLCIVNNSFDFIGTISGPSIAQYSWNFGPSASPTTATGTSVFGVVYSTPGNHTVTLTGSYLQCSESEVSNLFIFREPEVNFTIEPGLQCAPFMAQFIDLSVSDTPLQYLWDFGDGTTSTLQNPTHLYTIPGNYPVNLQVITNEGCPADINLTQNELVNVRPKPISSFTTSTDLADICNSEIVFIDQSTGAVSLNYWLDDDGYIAVDVPTVFPYYYQTSGYKNIQQIVTNEFGCKDTSYRQLYIEPFTVYIPNAFTPDADQYNNEWKPEVALQADEWHLIVYNRWGEKIWESYDQDAGWDGFYNGFKAPQGIYSYKINLSSCANEDKFQTLTGHFSLLK
jgi:gliding motility-associated-like protein